MAKKLLYILLVSILLVSMGQGLVSADSGAEHKTEQARPIKLGTSGGNINDSSSMYCCSGTLGGLVEDDSYQYILSNNHVMARSNYGVLGEDIIQPGLIDQSPVCAEDAADAVAQLADFVKIRFKKGRSIPINKVDAAIAVVMPGEVEPNGAIIDIGPLGTDIVAAAPGMAVKKSGRTSGFTTGTIGAINVTVDVGYSRECGGAANQVARFTDQILIDTPGFCAGGDSGSVIVENIASNPRAVGLLFAGSSDGSLTIANPMAEVLSAFGVTMPGGAPPTPEPGGTGTISGTVTAHVGGSGIEGAEVTVEGTGLSATTNANGQYSIADVPAGGQSVKATAAGFKSQTKSATVIDGQQTSVDFALKVSKRPPKANKKAVRRAISVKQKHEDKLLKVKGAVGAGIGLSDAGEPVIEIYLKNDSAEARSKIPAALDGVNVKVKVTGAFEAL